MWKTSNRTSVPRPLWEDMPVFGRDHLEGRVAFPIILSLIVPPQKKKKEKLRKERLKRGIEIIKKKKY